MAAARTFHIRPVLNGQPLAAVLGRLLPRQGPAEARRLVRDRHVQLNGNVAVDEMRRLKTGDVIKVFEHARAAPPTEQDVRVRHADEHLVVIEKPAGVTTLRQSDERDRPGRRLDRMATLEEMLQRVVARTIRPAPAAPTPRSAQPRHAKHPLARRGPPAAAAHRPRVQPPAPHRPPEVRPVHRLDRDTSGLMIFALSPEAEQALTRMFKEHVIDRTYVAVVRGHPAAQTIESYLVRDRGDGVRGSSRRGKDDPEAQRAVTHVRPVEHVGDYSVVECRLETGRTHQIRIHLAEIGHPLCGEKTYTRTAPVLQPIPDPSGAPRQALHSAKLQFEHPLTRQLLTFHSTFPHDLASWLNRLRRGAR